MRKHYKKIIVILVIGFFIYKYFLYIDIPNKCFIKIKHSLIELSSRNIKQGIKTLKRAAPDEYQKFCGNVKIINPNLACGGFQGGCYYGRRGEVSREIDISTAHSEFIAWTAAIISHETCHLLQAAEGRSLNEKECYSIDSDVLGKTVQF